MLDAYIEQRQSPQLFLSSFFKTTPKSFHSSEHVEVDTRRSEPHIAVPVASVDSGARVVEATKYVNEKFTPPVYDLETKISAWSTKERQPGVDPFEDPDFRANARSEAFYNLSQLEEMLRRAVELQASQIFQTGVVTLKDKNGTTLFTLDYGCRPSHYVTTTAWAADGSTGNPLADIGAMGQQLRTHGKLAPTDLLFGLGAQHRFLANTLVKTRLDNLGLQALQDISHSPRADGATYFGTIVIDHYRYRMWMYDGFYIDPQTLEPTRFLGDNKVIMLADNGRRDLTFGKIPMFVPPEARAAQFLPSRMSSVEQAFDMTTNIWVTPDGKHLRMSAGTRPLAIPTAKDTHGCLTVF